MEWLSHQSGFKLRGTQSDHLSMHHIVMPLFLNKVSKNKVLLPKNIVHLQGLPPRPGYRISLKISRMKDHHILLGPKMAIKPQDVKRERSIMRTPSFRKLVGCYEIHLRVDGSPDSSNLSHWSWNEIHSIPLEQWCNPLIEPTCRHHYTTLPSGNKTFACPVAAGSHGMRTPFSCGDGMVATEASRYRLWR